MRTFRRMVQRKGAGSVMDKGIDSYCGLCCGTCEYKEEFHCGGCIATGGHPFYGECELAQCARKKKVDFCGECKEFACTKLTNYSYDEQEGDEPKGARIERCKQIKAELVHKAREGKDPIGRCGHACDFCFQAQWCGGCRSDYNCCSYATLFEDKKCVNVECSKMRQMDGCYECDQLAVCEKGYYSVHMEFEAKAAALFIQKYGKECYRQTLIKALNDGMEYPKSFNDKGSVRAALQLYEKYRRQTDLW